MCFKITESSVGDAHRLKTRDRGVRGRKVERRPCNHEVPSSSPGSGSQLWDFSFGPHIRREYWCSSQEA